VHTPGAEGAAGGERAAGGGAAFGERAISVAGCNDPLRVFYYARKHAWMSENALLRQQVTVLSSCLQQATACSRAGPMATP